MRSMQPSTSIPVVLGAVAALVVAAIAFVALALASPASGHQGHPQKKLLPDRWYQQVQGGDYDAWMTLSTSDVWLDCGASFDDCASRWIDPFDASMADWNSQNTTVRFQYQKGVRDEELDVNVNVVDTAFGDPFLFGVATFYDINYDECFTTCTIYYGWVDIGDASHSGPWGSPQDRQATLSHELGHLLSLAHESVNTDESVRYECEVDDTGAIPVSIMSYNCIDPAGYFDPVVGANGRGIYQIQPWDVCGVNHAYFDPTIGYASESRVVGAGDPVCGSTEPTSTPEPSGTPTDKEGVQGDVDCDIDVDSVDALKDLRHVAALSVSQTEPCPNIETQTGTQLWGDVDCDGDVDSVDALKILRHVAALSVSQTEPCTDIGLPFAPLEGEGDIAITVVDAVSGDPLPGVTGRLHPAGAGRVQGTGVCGGAPFESTITNSSGQMAFSDVAAGFYSVTVDGGKDYIAICRENILVLGDRTTSLSVGLSPTLEAGEIRIVLSWNETPEDLDSHLWLPSSDPYHVCWNDQGSSSSFPFAELDLDDVFSFGPETITIYEPQPGIYTYAVHNFSDDFGGDTPLSQSGGHVDVFDEGGLIRSFDVPTSGDGVWWEVFTINAETGQVTSINQIGGDPQPYNVSGDSCP